MHMLVRVHTKRVFGLMVRPPGLTCTCPYVRVCVFANVKGAMVPGGMDVDGGEGQIVLHEDKK